MRVGWSDTFTGISPAPAALWLPRGRLRPLRDLFDRPLGVAKGPKHPQAPPETPAPPGTAGTPRHPQGEAEIPPPQGETEIPPAGRPRDPAPADHQASLRPPISHLPVMAHRPELLVR